ncbi:MAG: hypothetical protein HQM00_08575 [Magnetococcales bacterium]|nr:hypothetical protein [Magnetococcales bacterium]
MKTATRRLDAESIKRDLAPCDFYRAELPTMPPPKRFGWADGGLCPFHNDNRPGSFRVNLESGGFKCFACASSGGDIIKFLMLRDGLEFSEALKTLAEEWGLA